MLDFKIKELKRQIEPRETEIGSMKEQIKEMDRELEQVTPSIRLFDIILQALHADENCCRCTMLKKYHYRGTIGSTPVFTTSSSHDWTIQPDVPREKLWRSQNSDEPLVLRNCEIF